MLSFAMLCFGFLIGNAEAKKRKEGEGVLIEITVLDKEDDAPIATAVVKHAKESDPSRVNQLSGKWQAKEVFNADGEEFPFLPGSTEQFSISAPGYMTRAVTYDVRRRANVIEVSLEKMFMEQEEIEDLIIPFGRDQERDGGSAGGAN